MLYFLAQQEAGGYKKPFNGQIPLDIWQDKVINKVPFLRYSFLRCQPSQSDEGDHNDRIESVFANQVSIPEKSSVCIDRPHSSFFSHWLHM